MGEATAPVREAIARARMIETRNYADYRIKRQSEANERRRDKVRIKQRRKLTNGYSTSATTVGEAGLRNRRHEGEDYTQRRRTRGIATPGAIGSLRGRRQIHLDDVSFLSNKPLSRPARAARDILDDVEGRSSDIGNRSP